MPLKLFHRTSRAKAQMLLTCGSNCEKPSAAVDALTPSHIWLSEEINETHALAWGDTLLRVEIDSDYEALSIWAVASQGDYEQWLVPCFKILSIEAVPTFDSSEPCEIRSVKINSRRGTPARFEQLEIELRVARVIRFLQSERPLTVGQYNSVIRHFLAGVLERTLTLPRPEHVKAFVLDARRRDPRRPEVESWLALTIARLKNDLLPRRKLVDAARYKLADVLAKVLRIEILRARGRILGFPEGRPRSSTVAHAEVVEEAVRAEQRQTGHRRTGSGGAAGAVEMTAAKLHKSPRTIERSLRLAGKVLPQRKPGRPRSKS